MSKTAIRSILCSSVGRLLELKVWISARGPSLKMFCGKSAKSVVISIIRWRFCVSAGQHCSSVQSGKTPRKIYSCRAFIKLSFDLLLSFVCLEHFYCAASAFAVNVLIHDYLISPIKMSLCDFSVNISVYDLCFLGIIILKRLKMFSLSSYFYLSLQIEISATGRPAQS